MVVGVPGVLESPSAFEALADLEPGADRRLAGATSHEDQQRHQVYAAGAVLLADDATGAGVADDPLLVLVDVGLIGVFLASKAPAEPADLSIAWMEVVTALQEVGHAAGTILRAAPAPEMPSRKNCRRHLIGCLGTSLGRPGSGRSQNHSVCADCFEVCRGDGAWPDRGRDGKSCRWWELR